MVSGNGSSADGRRITSLTYIQLGYHDYFTSGQTVAITQINNYTNTNTHKTILNRTSNAAVGVGFSVGLYASTSTITTFDALPLLANWAVGTVFTLYGIKAA
jgi:hypothetical protein